MALDTVLVVDEPEAAHEAGSTLTRFSYRVLIAANGQQALRMLKANGPVDLVLSKVLIPGAMSGISLAGRIRVSYPATAVILMTPPHHQPIDSSIPVLIKPFARSTLIARVQKVLGDARRSAELLTKTFQARRATLNGLASARSSVSESVRQYRQQRTDRFCSRLRTAVIKPTIVVAEDDSALRYSLCHYLNLCGFRVLEASDGQEVLSICREHVGSIDVLVTDFRMPGLNGVELAHAVTAELPRTSIIYITGEDVELPGPTLRKPIDLDDLLAEIVGVLVKQ